MGASHMGHMLDMYETHPGYHNLTLEVDLVRSTRRTFFHQSHIKFQREGEGDGAGVADMCILIDLMLIAP